MEIEENNAKPWIVAIMITTGLISVALSIWLLSETLSAYAQEYCPSGAVVTAQSQCPGAVGPIDNLTKSILRLNNSGVNNPNDTAIKIQKDNKNNTGVQTVQNTISQSNMTGAGNMTKSAQPSQPLSQPQILNTIPSIALNEIFQKCFMSALDPTVRSVLNSMDIAVMEREAVQNMTAPLPFKHITNNSATDQWIYDENAKGIKPIADCMRQEQQQPYQQQPYQQQQPSNNYPLPSILSQSAYTDSIGSVHIVGEVINQSPVTAKFVKIIVTFYNAYNQVIGTDFTFTQPSDLAPGQRAPFDIAVLSGGIPMAQVRNYALSVDIS